MYTYYQFKNPSELISGKYASVVIPSTELPELPTVAIANWIDKLTQVFKEKFTEAAKAKNVEQLTKFFQLFPLINQEEIGLNCYSKFICEIINETSKSLTAGLENAHDLKPAIFSNVVMQLFENISMMLSQHGPLIKNTIVLHIHWHCHMLLAKSKEKSIYKLELLLTPFMI